MSVSSGGGVKAEPNVTPMIDVMLVLLIIFMIVVPQIQAGFKAQPPTGQNIKQHPEDENTDQVLGIDRNGQYFLNKRQIDNAQLEALVTDIYTKRTVDKIMYVKADKGLAYGKVQDALDIIAKGGVRVSGLITDQTPGTESTVEGDIPKVEGPMVPGGKK
ncbi:MAG: biopolymer transporter ExbD [Gemmatimonadaceae bacterium]|jgi:biopolymer transport protein ExbD|nr:biopolymer transporter ExbD [Gemmatimonadaceae bacterium]